MPQALMGHRGDKGLFTVALLPGKGMPRALLPTVFVFYPGLRPNIWP